MQYAVSILYVCKLMASQCWHYDRWLITIKMKIETLEALEFSLREMPEWCRLYLSLLYHILISSSVSSPLRIIFKVRFSNSKWSNFLFRYIFLGKSLLFTSNLQITVQASFKILRTVTRTMGLTGRSHSVDQWHGEIQLGLLFLIHHEWSSGPTKVPFKYCFYTYFGTFFTTKMTFDRFYILRWFRSWLKTIDIC